MTKKHETKIIDHLLSVTLKGNTNIQTDEEGHQEKVNRTTK